MFLQRPFARSSSNLPLPFHSSVTIFLSPLFFCVSWITSTHYMWSNAPISQSGYTSVHISVTHSLCAGAPNQYCFSSHWRPQTHTEHTGTPLHTTASEVSQCSRPAINHPASSIQSATTHSCLQTQSGGPDVCKAATVIFTSYKSLKW